MIYNLLLTLVSSPYAAPSIAFVICFIIGVCRFKHFKIKDVEIDLKESALEEE